MERSCSFLTGKSFLSLSRSVFFLFFSRVYLHYKRDRTNATVEILLFYLYQYGAHMHPTRIKMWLEIKIVSKQTEIKTILFGVNRKIKQWLPAVSSPRTAQTIFPTLKTAVCRIWTTVMCLPMWLSFCRAPSTTRSWRSWPCPSSWRPWSSSLSSETCWSSSPSRLRIIWKAFKTGSSPLWRLQTCSSACWSCLSRWPTNWWPTGCSEKFGNSTS